MSKTKWLIVYCESDTSFSLIQDSEAVFDQDSLEVGDRVKFFFDRSEYEGDVRAIGGDEDYDSLTVKLDELNALNKKKRDSFHADQPRRNRGGGKFQGALNVLKPCSNKPPQQERSLNQETKAVNVTKESDKSPLSRLLQEVDHMCDFSDETEVSCFDHGDLRGPSPDSSADESQEAAQLKRKNREADLKELKKIKRAADSVTSKGSGTSKITVRVNNQPESSQKPTSSKQPGAIKIKNKTVEGPTSSKKSSGVSKTSDASAKTSDASAKTSDASAKTSEPFEMSESPKSIRQTVGPVQRKSIFGSGSSDNWEHVYTDSEEDGEAEDKAKNKNKKKSTNDESTTDKGKPEIDFKMLRWEEEDDDVIVIEGKSKELIGKKFFVSPKDLRTAKGATNASTFSKALLVAAFTDEALFKCSLSGGQYRAAGRANITQRPALDGNVVEVIVDVALKRQAAKKWNPVLIKKEIMNGLRQKLVDVRPRLSKLMKPVEDK